MNHDPCRVLLVEDNPGDARLLQEALKECGARFELTHVEALARALDRVQQEEFDVVLLDLSLPDEQGLRTFSRMYERAPGTPILVLTGLDDEAMAVRTVHEGAQDYLVKGEVEGRSLVRAMRYAIERKRAEAERARLLESERRKSEQLKLAVREAHHRIKNNLQAISDLLYLEAASNDATSAADMLQETVERIQSIALVHDLLTQDEDVQTVDIQVLAERLIPMVLHSNSRHSAEVETELRVPSVLLSSKKATTLALILNELVSNAVKHAFAGRRDGRLRVELEQADEGLRLRVQDNGPGLPESFDLSRDAHVGLQVVRTLAERDLAGRFTLAGEQGLSAVVWFPW